MRRIGSVLVVLAIFVVGLGFYRGWFTLTSPGSDTKEIILKPTYPWEFVQVGYCGSPIDTDKGWLVLSHGVGPMRKYSIGAFLLDRDDPSRLIGRLKQPLVTPNENEREGYVPNVVYSCGAVVHNGQLIVPYAISDYATTFGTIPLDELRSAMAPA
jgi:predicted GH43/DUF377 family glycosyl hydrolase